MSSIIILGVKLLSSIFVNILSIKEIDLLVIRVGYVISGTIPCECNISIKVVTCLSFPKLIRLRFISPQRIILLLRSSRQGLKNSRKLFVENEGER